MARATKETLLSWQRENNTKLKPDSSVNRLHPIARQTQVRRSFETNKSVDSLKLKSSRQKIARTAFDKTNLLRESGPAVWGAHHVGHAL